jgi:dihydroxyacid dehydratase/phosphogluconate dehydratase
MMPAVSRIIAEGVIRSLDDLKKPFVAVVNNTGQIPGHAHLDKIGVTVRDELN